ncbi:hypothetical protein [Aminobacter sp. HY435]|uniref:hypothetical protein n=1 Tax=Aminobacter sp. HY435 TaxID=2970917 RepID=UPI0022B94636|nr:hypothetical protein [Aminobacter sp. HY435]
MAQAEERWRAVRALYEGAPADAGTLSRVSGWKEATIRRRIERHGWIAGTDGVVDERLVRLADSLVGQVETLRAESAGALDKAQIEMVGLVVRTVEKITELMRGGEVAKVSQTNRDAEMADVLARIDRRIVELARSYARVLGTAEHNRS